VIIVSVVNDAATIDRCMSAGANAYHVKPIRRADLISTLNAQLAGRAKPKPPAAR
jgi:DNA-binding NarL/FixJ family response regulator